jgi:hypothetical protein
MSKLGAEILVNTQTLYDQTLSQSAKLNNGGFVTVWVDWASDIDITLADGSWSGIKAQVFSATGARVGTEILVNTATLNWQQDPHVAVLRDGNFVVTWTDGWDYFSWANHPGSQGVGGATADDYGKAVKLQVFSPDGAPIGTEIVATTEIRDNQTAEKITALGNGNFVVTWEDWSLSCRWAADGSLIEAGGGPGLKAQVFNSTGAKVGAELAVTGSYNYGPQITNLANGGFVITWHDGHYSVDDVRAQVFSDTGTKVGSESLVNTAGAGATYSVQNEERVVGLSNGGFAVAWTDKNGDDSYDGVKAQVFDATGGKVGTEILVNTTTFSYQWHPQLAALKDGGFVVTWDKWSSGLDVNGIDVNAQIFDNSGARVGSEIVANTSTAGLQQNAQISPLDSGGFAVSWFDSNGTWSGYSGVPKFQVFDALGNKVGLENTPNTTPASGGASPITALDNGTFVVDWSAWDESGYGVNVKAQVFSLGSTLTGGPDNDAITSGPGNDTIDGGAGIDTAIYSGNIANYTLTKTGSSYTIHDKAGADGTDTLTNIETVKFADKTINLTVQTKAASAPQADVTRLSELYVAFFNRVPDADGMSYWIDQMGAGQSITQIADSFYSAGVQYSSLTGFSIGMTDADFVKVIYKNVLGRTGTTAPPDADVNYWVNNLTSGADSRGSLINTILAAAHGFKGDTTWGWVPDLLDNKITVAKFFAIDWGLNYNTANESITQGMAIAAAVTSTDTAAAIALIGVDATALHLL